MSSVGSNHLTKLQKQRIRARKARAFKRRMIMLVVIVLVVSSLAAIYYFGNRPSSGPSSEPNKVLLRTTMGDITIQLYDDMPITTGNFKNLVKTGVYDGTIFHRVIDNFMIQGGGEENLVYSCYLSAPNVKGAKLFEEMSKNDIKQVSCNTTFGGTALGLVLETEKPENIKDVYGTFIRRENDPGSKKKKEQELGPETKFKTHHGEDIQKVVEPLEEKIISTPALKCPWEHFHETVITIDFIEPYDFDAIEKTFEKYPRAVILRSNFDMGDIIEKINELNIPDADCLFPLYHLRQPTYTKKGPNGEERKTNKLEIVGLTPQRSIVAPSIADMVVKKALKPGATWEEAYDYVNNHAKWFAYKFGTLKKDLEYKMEPKI